MEIESPIETDLKKKIESLETFLHFIGMNSKRNPCKIKVEFIHNRFRDDKGFASLDMEGQITRRILNAIEEEVQKNIMISREQLRQMESYNKTE